MRSVELFVGAGGLAIGTAHAGFTHESVIDFDQFACATLRRNKADGVAPARNWEIIERDVREYDFSRHKGNADVVIGGPPCQPFSLGGKHLGAADHRNMVPPSRPRGAGNRAESLHVRERKGSPATRGTGLRPALALLPAPRPLAWAGVRSVVRPDWRTPNLD